MEKKAQMKLCVFHTCLTSYSCLKPYPSAVFIWLMCWRRSATLTAGWSWPVWYGELFLRQWRWGEPPSKLLDSLTELRCSSGNTNRYSSRHPADTEDSAAHALFFFINVKKSRGQLKGKSQHFCGDVSADWCCRIFKQTRAFQEISLSKASYVLTGQIGYMFANMAEGQKAGSCTLSRHFLKSTHVVLAALLRALQPWASMKEWAILSSCWRVLCSVMLQSRELSFRLFSCL